MHDSLWAPSSLIVFNLLALRQGLHFGPQTLLLLSPVVSAEECFFANNECTIALSILIDQVPYIPRNLHSHEKLMLMMQFG